MKFGFCGTELGEKEGVLDPVWGETAPLDGAVPKILLPEAARSASRDLRESLRYAFNFSYCFVV